MGLSGVIQRQLHSLILLLLISKYLTSYFLILKFLVVGWLGSITRHSIHFSECFLAKDLSLGLSMIYMIKRYHVNTEARFHPLTSELLSLGALITVST